jgi:hypothetical protein
MAVLEEMSSQKAQAPVSTPRKTPPRASLADRMVEASIYLLPAGASLVAGLCKNPDDPNHMQQYCYVMAGGLFVCGLLKSCGFGFYRLFQPDRRYNNPSQQGNNA